MPDNDNRSGGARDTAGDAFSLPAPFNLEGQFWDPVDPQRRVRGRLTWQPTRPTLALEDVLHPPAESMDPLQRVIVAGRDRAAVIAGSTVFGEPLCLIDCFVHRMEGSRVHHPQPWSVTVTLLGVDTPPAAVHGIELRVPDMRPLYGEPLFSLDRAAAGPRETLTMTWQSSPELTIELDQLRLVIDDDWIVLGPVWDLSLRATPRIRLLPAVPRPASSFARRPDVLSHCSKSAGAAPSKSPRHGCFSTESARRSSREPRTKSTDAAPWLALGDLQPIQRTFERWMGLCENNPHAVALLSEYLASVHAVPTADRLTYLARFFEEYYRSLPTSVQLPKKQSTLATRLQQLADLHAPALHDALGKAADTFGQRVADTRNYYIRYDDKLAAKAAAGLDLCDHDRPALDRSPRVLASRAWFLSAGGRRASTAGLPPRLAGATAMRPHLNRPRAGAVRTAARPNHPPRHRRLSQLLGLLRLAVRQRRRLRASGL